MKTIVMKTTKRMMLITMIAVVYVVISIFLAPFSFGPIQCRVSEALCVLPILSFWAIPGVTLGCFISNLIGIFSGANPLGFIDLFCGTVATLIAAEFSYYLRENKWHNRPMLSFLSPIIVNGIIIGLELSLILFQDLSTLFFCIMQVTVGEALVILFIGVPLFRHLENKGILSNIV